MPRTTTIDVGEIHCGSYESTIRTVLARLDGGFQVAPSAKTDQVKVSYDGQAVSEDDPRARLSELGYEAVG